MDRLAQLPLRDSLKGEEPYGAPQLAVDVALNVNENTHPLSESVIEDILAKVKTALFSLNRYPDRDAETLRTALAEYLGHGLTWQNVWAANGSNEILQQILQAFGGPGRAVLSFEPTYSMYPLLARGTETKYIASEREADFQINAREGAGQIREHRPTVTIVCTPNNPTGTITTLETLRELYEAVEEVEGILVVDEAYAEFSRDPKNTALTLLPGRPRLIVSRTMSKAFALAGARLGYLAGAPEVVSALQLVRLPYHLSAVTQAVAIAALEHASDQLATVADIREQRDRIVDTLRALGYQVADTDANFVLFSGVSDPDQVWQKLLDRSILVRKSPLPNTLRVSAGTVAETDAFLSAMEEITAQQHTARESTEAE